MATSQPPSPCAAGEPVGLLAPPAAAEKRASPSPAPAPRVVSVVEEVTCPEGHVCTQLTESVRSYGGWCRACRAGTSSCQLFYHCSACKFELCPACAALPKEERSRLVKATECKYTSAQSLVDAAEGGGTKLLSGKWLVAFEASRGQDEPLKRQQDLPSDAFVDPAMLRAMGISAWAIRREYMLLAVSHCWRSPAHPDPKGQQLGVLARVLSAMRAQYWTCSDIAVFLDYCSLPQEPRSAHEEAAFALGMRDVHLWFAHAEAWVLMLTEPPAGWPDARSYFERGWPTFECRISSLVKDKHMCLDVGRIDPDQDLADLVQRGVRTRCAPQSPEAFAQAVEDLHFSRRTDVPFVQGRYRQAVVEVFAYVKELALGSLDWGPAQMQDLAQVLPLASRLQHLELVNNQLGDAGCTALARALPSCSALQWVWLHSNQIGDAGAVAMAQALPSCPALEDLGLNSNQVGDAGAIALAQVLPRCGALRVLDLHANQIGASGVRALEEAAREQGEVCATLSGQRLVCCALQ